MRGHEKIIAMRLRGKAPEVVFLNDWPCETDWAEWGEFPTVCVAGDSIPLLDLRFLIGLTVSISSDSEERAKALFEACKAVPVAVVVSLHIDGNSAAKTWGRMWKKPVMQQELEAE